MRALVVYESMYGNTHTVASHIGEGLGSMFEVTVVPVGDATAALLEASDLLVVGGPTHVHSMSSDRSRQAARDAAKKEDEALTLDPDAEGPGLRDWFHGLGDGHRAPAAAFDTRVDASPALTGRASKGIARRLRHHGFDLALDPESFLVDKHNRLVAGEAERATRWGAALAAALGAAALRIDDRSHR